MLDRHLVLSALIVGLLMGMIGSIYDPNLIAFAQREEQNTAYVAGDKLKITLVAFLSILWEPIVVAFIIVILATIIKLMD